MLQRRQGISVWFPVILLVASLGACSEPGAGGAREHRARRGMMEYIKSLDTTIHFYGKVVDQNGRPVDGAKVSAGIRRFSPVGTYFMESKDLTVKTGPDGLFEVFELRGAELFIREIDREGYEFRRIENRNSSFEYGVGKGAIGPPAFVPDKNKPVIFRMRKKLQDRTFLFKNRDWGFRISLDQMNTWGATDFVEKHRVRQIDGLEKEEHDVICDLKYKAVLDAEAQEWTVFFSACGADSGVFVSGEELYKAPEEGYRDEWRIVIPVGIIRERDDDPPSPCLYIKSRSPSIYSKIVVKTIYSDPDVIRMYGKMTINPYGDRVLDSVDIPLESKEKYKFAKRLKAQAKAALKEGRLPPRPKIMALIEAAKRGELAPEEASDPKARNPK